MYFFNSSSSNNQYRVKLWNSSRINSNWIFQNCRKWRNNRISIHQMPQPSPLRDPSDRIIIITILLLQLRLSRLANLWQRKIHLQISHHQMQLLRDNSRLSWKMLMKMQIINNFKQKFLKINRIMFIHRLITPWSPLKSVLTSKSWMSNSFQRMVRDTFFPNNFL